MEEEKRWYVLHTYSGHENKVKTSLESAIQIQGLEDVIGRVLIPYSEEMEEKNGVQKIVKHKVFPGYVLIEMVVNNKSWYVVRNTPGVTGFVGSATKPTPLTESEVAYILKSQDSGPVKLTLEVEIGEVVRITAGAFENRFGTITEINQDKSTLTLSVEMFNRDTSVEVDFSQIEKSL